MTPFETLTVLPVALVALLLTAPVWLRFTNEITCRIVGRAVVICPHCGTPGVVETTHPKVIR